jgi:hypothetical protein
MLRRRPGDPWIFVHVERVLAEADGLILAVVTGLLGLGVKALELHISKRHQYGAE